MYGSSVLILVGDCEKLLQRVVERASALKAGQKKGQIGPVINAASQQRILKYVNGAMQYVKKNFFFERVTSLEKTHTLEHLTDTVQKHS